MDILDKVVQRLDVIDYDLFTITQDGLRNIKMMVTVALIYEITRSQSDEDKTVLRAFFQKAMRQREPPFTKEQKDRFARLDPLRVSNLTYFKCTDKGRKQLLLWYDENHTIESGAGEKRTVYEGSFPEQYKHMLEDILNNSKQQARPSLIS